jgi:CRISPR/Cas system CMR subunit Cmr6 (Cas7 group RAMP superfamily)
MAKFKQMLTNTGDSLINKRADNLTAETKDIFEDEKRRVEKEIRNIKNRITSMEDLSVKSTQTLIVGENLDTKKWVSERINLELELNDLQVELKIIEQLMADYFA